MKLEYILLDLEKITTLSKYNQLILLKELLPELEKHKDQLQTEFTRHLILKGELVGSAALEF